MKENLLGRIFKINHGGKQFQLVQKATVETNIATFFYFFLTVIIFTKAIGSDYSVKRGLKPLLLARVIRAVSRYSKHFSFESADPV